MGLLVGCLLYNLHYSGSSSAVRDNATYSKYDKIAVVSHYTELVCNALIISYRLQGNCDTYFNRYGFHILEPMYTLNGDISMIILVTHYPGLICIALTIT